jgi:hypothetical protein
MFKKVIAAVLLAASPGWAQSWKSDPIWHDGLVEKATYDATRVIYGQPRSYTAVFFTNKEQHDLKTLTKVSASKDQVEVFKHNQIEVIPTPNYNYKFTTTAHLSAADLKLTRLDMSSQEYCGTSFKQYQRVENARIGAHLDYFGFSYMPEAGRVTKRISAGSESLPVVAADSLPLWLRGYDFETKPVVKFLCLPSQKSNQPSAIEPVEHEVRYLRQSEVGHVLVVQDSKRPAQEAAGDTYTFSLDRQHVMTAFSSEGGEQTYTLTKHERVNYWTIKGE